MQPAATLPEPVRRARPWLGTLVEVGVAPPTVPTPDWNAIALVAFESAFAAIARVDASMSFQNKSSELSQYNRLEPGQWLCASDDLLAVLAFSVEVSAKTDGVFDVCLAGADWRAIVLDCPLRKVGKLAPLTVDLSGVAKGYAVDCAVSALQACGMQSGWVNAGGDGRVFGALTAPLHVRAPTNASQLYDCGVLHNSAAATSASYLLSNAVLREGASRQLVNRPESWTVRAPTCMVADAMTKVLAASGYQHRAVFEHYSARGWVLS